MQSPPPRTSPTRIRLRIAVGVVALVCAYCIVEGTRYGVAVWYAHRGLDELAGGEVERGIELIDRAGNWHDEHPGRLVRARQFFADRADDEAIRVLGNLIEDERTRIDALDLLGRIHERRGQTDLARTRYEELLATSPEHPAGALGLARLGDRTVLDGLLARLQKDRSVGDPGSVRGAIRGIRGISLLHLSDALGSSGYGTPDAALSLLMARHAGADSVSLRVPIRQPSVHEPQLTAWQEPAGGETRDALVAQIRDAKALGFSVMLKPHVMLDEITDDEWRGIIEYADPNDRAIWWAGYRAFMEELLDLAEREAVDIVCVGVELRGLVRTQPDAWRALIRDARTRYRGQLTYAANWYLEFEEVPFWADLDLVGVQFFFPIAESEDPSEAELRAGVDRAMARVREVAARAGRPALWTEIGCRSTPGAAAQPWIWPEPGDPPSAELQRRAYAAFIGAAEAADWLRGLYVWNWLTTPRPGTKFEHDFTPQGKPAGRVLEEAWR